jgi:hypothetical protein
MDGAGMEFLDLYRLMEPILVLRTFGLYALTILFFPSLIPHCHAILHCSLSL